MNGELVLADSLQIMRENLHTFSVLILSDEIVRI